MTGIKDGKLSFEYVVKYNAEVDKAGITDDRVAPAIISDHKGGLSSGGLTRSSRVLADTTVGQAGRVLLDALDQFGIDVDKGSGSPGLVIGTVSDPFSKAWDDFDQTAVWPEPGRHRREIRVVSGTWGTIRVETDREGPDRSFSA